MRVRDFMGIDFDPLSRLLGTTWHTSHGQRSYWQGADELCDHLARSDKALVALGDEDEFFGAIILAGPRDGAHNDMLRSHWLQQRTRIAAMASALGIDARADVAPLNAETAFVTEVAEREFGPDSGEVILLIVAAEARGQGVGKALMRTGLAWLAEQGAADVYLVTDAVCDWQMYDHLGMRRVATQEGTNRFVYAGRTEELVAQLGR